MSFGRLSEAMSISVCEKSNNIPHDDFGCGIHCDTVPDFRDFLAAKEFTENIPQNIPPNIEQNIPPNIEQNIPPNVP